MPSPKLYKFYFKVESENPAGEQSIEVYSCIACNLISALVTIMHDQIHPLAEISKIEIVHGMKAPDDSPFTIIVKKESDQ